MTRSLSGKVAAEYSKNRRPRGIGLTNPHRHSAPFVRLGRIVTTHAGFRQQRHQGISKSNKHARVTRQRSKGRCIMDNLIQKLMLGGSTAALFAAMPVAAFAQDSSGIEQVVVSASRRQIAGYQHATPVSVVGASQLLEAANADVGDTLRQMPSMGNSATPEKGTNGNAGNSGALGVSGINLRNLGPTRNLVLVDGQRVVYAGLTAGVDLSVIPNTVVQRVDVVTGGASAAWGSDAVSGVVNLIINKNFSGTKASIDLQDDGQDNRRSYGFTVTNGFDAFGGRSHVEWAVTYNDSPQTVFETSAHWFQNPTLIANPLYNATTNPKVPQLIHINNAG